MLIRTFKFMLIVLIFIVSLCYTVYVFIEPVSKVSFFVAGKMSEPFERLAKEQMNNTTSELTKTLYNFTVESEMEKKVGEAVRNTRMFWLIAPFVAFVVAILFYTGWSEVTKR